MERVPTLREISIGIKRVRGSLGLTQKKLASLARISQAALARIEREPEKYNPGYSAIHSIVEALNSELSKTSPQNIKNKPVSEIMHKKIVSIKPTDSFYHALKLMKNKNISQLPVIDNTGTPLGTIYQRQITEILLQNKNPKALPVKEIMKPALPQIDKNTPLAKTKTILEEWPAILITKNQKITGIITSYDWLKAVK